MKKREWIGLILTLVVIALLANPVGEFLDGLVDAAWWDVLPWVLLALLWIAFGIRAWRSRRDGQGREH